MARKKFDDGLYGALMLLLAFLVGSSFTWMLTVGRFQHCPVSEGLPEALYIRGRPALNLSADAEKSRIFPGILQRRASAQSQQGKLDIPTHGLKLPNRTFYLPGNDKQGQNSERNSSKPVRVLCWIMTSPKTLEDRAKNVHDTWGPRCDVTLYMSSQAEPDFPGKVVGLDVAEGRDALWNKTRAALLYLSRYHMNDADWFLKADDDTFVSVENLRRFLGDKNASEPVYYGHHFKMYIEQGYMSGGAGYVMSREALRRLAPKLSATDVLDGHRGMSKAEDVALGWCLMKSGVKTGDSRDSQNRSRFLPFDLETFVNDEQPHWYFKFAKYPVKKGRDCCSDSLISVHYVRERRQMIMLDYLIHDMQKRSSQ